MVDDESEQRASIALAEAVLTRTFGGAVLLDDAILLGGGSRRTNVLCCRVSAGPRGVPHSVVVKRVRVGSGERYDPEAIDGPAPRLFAEWASLQFLSDLGTEPPLAPRLYGGDRDAGLIVMENLGQGASLVQPLTGNSHADVMDALEVFFRSLGRLNAVTCGHAAEYSRIRARLGAPDPLLHYTLEAVRDWLAGLLRSVCERVGLTPDEEVLRDVSFVAGLDVNAGPFLTFSQSDTCPDNCIRQGDWMCFFDFEWGRFRNALSDGARARGNFASCGYVNRLPDDVVRHCESAYRTELVKGCPAAADDSLFHRTLVTACAYSTLFALDFYPDPWSSDSVWGLSTVRQRIVYRFQQLARTTAEFGYLEALGDQSRKLADKLALLWPGLEPMPYYPPFRQP
jgi:hypothetical protein